VRAYLCLFAAVITWGVEYPLMRYCSNRIGFLRTGAIMFSVAAVLLGLTLLVRQTHRKRMPTLSWNVFPYRNLLLVGLLGFGVNIFGIWGIKLTTVTNSSTLARSDVLFSLLLSSFVFHEPISKWAFACAPVMLAGIFLLAGIRIGQIHVGHAGDYLMLASALCLSLNAYAIKRAVQRVSGFTVGLFNATIIGTLFITVALAAHGPTEILKFDLSILRPALLLGTLTFIFFTTYNVSLRTIPVWEVRLLCLIVPVVATMVGWVWLKEVPSPLQWLGMALVTAGAAGIIVARRPEATPPIEREKQACTATPPES